MVRSVNETSRASRGVKQVHGLRKGAAKTRGRLCQKPVYGLSVSKMIAQACPEDDERLDTIFEEDTEDSGEEKTTMGKGLRRPAPTPSGAEEQATPGRAARGPFRASKSAPDASPHAHERPAQEAQTERKGVDRERETGDFLKWPYWNTGIAPTTLELTNLPKWMTSELLSHHLDNWGFQRRYNFVHVPVTRGISLGHASVNAVSHADGLAMAKLLHGFRGWSNGTAAPPCRVGWNLWLQGLEQLIVDHQQSTDASESPPWIWTGTHWAPLQCAYWWPQWC